MEIVLTEQEGHIIELMYKGVKGTVPDYEKVSVTVGITDEELQEVADGIDGSSKLRDHVMLLPMWFPVKQCILFLQEVSLKSKKERIHIVLSSLGVMYQEIGDTVKAKIICSLATQMVNALGQKSGMLEALITCIDLDISPENLAFSRVEAYKAYQDSHKTLNLGPIIKQNLKQ